ncbi:MAG TPA: chromate efflux transporter [Candidatus Eisenbacteria bacterium]|nr:chromate efflux transporter [Candidatus Eisenbacteria bacterium]
MSGLAPATLVPRAATRRRPRPPLLLVVLVTAAGACAVLDHLTHGISAWVFVALMLVLIAWAMHGGTDAPAGAPATVPARPEHAWPPPAGTPTLVPPPVEVAPIAQGPGRMPGGRELLREGVTLGLIGFGGGLAVLTQIEHRICDRRRWIASDTFLESAALAQSLPGAVAFNALGFIGWRLAGLAGALTLVAGFVLPSFLILLVFALLYPHLRHLRVVEGLFAALTPAVVGLVAATAIKLGSRVTLTPSGEPGGWRGLLGDRWALLVMIVAGVAVAFLGFGVPEVVLAAGVLGIVRELFPSPAEPGRRLLDFVEVRWRWLRWRVWAASHHEDGRRPWWRRRMDEDDLPGFAPVAPLAMISLSGAYQGLQQLGSLAGIFLRAGALTFGGGFVMIPLLEAELVQARHWLTPQAFADAMALGQVTPGPVVITATFVGYVLSGLAGAIVSTVAVFLPSFVLVLLVSSSMERFRGTLTVQAFLHGIQPAVVGLMMAAAISLGRNGIDTWTQAALAVIAFLLLVRWRMNPVWVVLGAAGLGLAEAGARVLYELARG